MRYMTANDCITFNDCFTVTISVFVMTAKKLNKCEIKVQFLNNNKISYPRIFVGVDRIKLGSAI